MAYPLWQQAGGLAAVALTALPATAAPSRRWSEVAVVLGREAGTVERNAARVLVQRLSATGRVAARIEQEPGASDGRALRVLLGLRSHHPAIDDAFKRLRIPSLTELAPGPEGFLLRALPEPDPATVLAVGIDGRGCVYAVGELLRRAIIRHDGLEVPAGLDVRTAPAFEIRGTQFGQSGVLVEKAKARRWTQAEVESKIADFALAGANVLQVGVNSTEDDPTYRYIKGLGLKTIVHWSANAGSGPPEWQAQESIGRTGYLCPSIPEARKELLRSVEAAFAKSPHFDYVSFSGGDGGGCECDRCKPYGAVFIRLVEDYAAIVHKYHPDAQVMFTNQKFDNEDDLAIFRYLRETPNTGIRAFCVGPGSDAMSWQPGHRQHHRMDLFRYPRFGPFSRYMQEIVHQLPPHVDLAFYNEITHWRYAQHAYVQAYPRPDKDGNHPPPWNHFIYERMPDPYITQVYDRLTFFAWPRFYRWVFGEVVRHGLGDCTHSSGTHDHFNQWMWQRLLWSPQRTVEDVVDEYARTWFGPEAAPLMAKAIFLMEEYLQWDPERPITQKTSIDRYYGLVMKAGRVMPSWLRERSWLWREFAQKAAIDKRTKLAVGQQMALQRSIERDVAAALSASVIPSPRLGGGDSISIPSPRLGGEGRVRGVPFVGDGDLTPSPSPPGGEGSTPPSLLVAGRDSASIPSPRLRGEGRVRGVPFVGDGDLTPSPSPPGGEGSTPPSLLVAGRDSASIPSPRLAGGDSISIPSPRLRGEGQGEGLGHVARDASLNRVVDASLARLAGLKETPAMRRLREEAERLGEESNALYGVRSEGLASLDHDFIGLGWLKRQLERARAATGEAKLDLLATVADYENPGPGGFYDNLGTYERAPHLVKGYPYDHGQPYVGDMLDERNRISQRTMCGTQDEAEGIALRYEGLDPKARYRIRFTLVRPWFQPRYAHRMNQKAQSVYADGIPLAEGLELPEKMSDFFTYDIPPEATADGVLSITFRKMPDVASGDRVSVEQWRNCGGWGTLCSEAWLMRKR